MECFEWRATTFSRCQFPVFDASKNQMGISNDFALADHLIFEAVQHVQQSIWAHELFQGLNYMVEMKKKLYFKCFNR